jgi:hypothetical protein
MDHLAKNFKVRPQPLSNGEANKEPGTPGRIEACTPFLPGEGWVPMQAIARAKKADARGKARQGAR